MWAWYDANQMSTQPTAFHVGVVFIGAGVGGVLRYVLGGAVQRWWGEATPGWGAFPLGTVVVNVTGCLAIGVLGALLMGAAQGRETMRLALMVGVLGGYTTFSSFGRETLMLIDQGRWQLAVLNVVVSNAAGVLAVFAGHWLGGILAGVTGGAGGSGGGV